MSTCWRPVYRGTIQHAWAQGDGPVQWTTLCGLRNKMGMPNPSGSACKACLDLDRARPAAPPPLVPPRFTAAGVRDIASGGLFQCPSGYCNVCGSNPSRCPKLALRAYADLLDLQEKLFNKAAQRAASPKRRRT